MPAYLQYPEEVASSQGVELPQVMVEAALSQEEGLPQAMVEVALSQEEGLPQVEVVVAVLSQELVQPLVPLLLALELQEFPAL